MKTIIITILCICSLNAVCQIKNVYCEYHIISIIYKKDTLKFDFPQVVTLKELGYTPIVPLWAYGPKNYGVKLELLKSNVALQDEFILSKCFYIKDGDSWKEIHKSANLQQDIFKVSPCDFTKDRNWVRGSEGGGEDFNVSYMQIIYVN